MTYRRFTLPGEVSAPATLVNPATVSVGLAGSVAVVASVAASKQDPRAIASAADWLDCFEERAAIREYEGEFTRLEAEHLAWADTITALGQPPTIMARRFGVVEGI